MSKCEKWLKELLTKENEMLYTTVRSEAKRMGFTRGELKTARKNLGVKTFHQFDEDGATPNYFWYLEVNGNA